MAEENDAASKTEEPTPHKLEEARKKGDIARSADLSQAAALAGAFGVLAIAGGWMMRNLANALVPFIDHPDAISLQGGAGVAVAKQAAMAAAPALLAVMLATAVCGVAGSLLQGGLVISAEKMKPDLKKLSPMQGFKRLFGPDGLMNFARAFLKVAATGAVAWFVLKPHAAQMEGMPAMAPGAILPVSLELCRKLMLAVVLMLVVAGGMDFLWQRYRFLSRMRMSREEIKDEYKQTEGDPHIKAKLKQMRAEKSRRRMMQNVPKATVVVMNPTHYAVALRYVAGETGAPECVAKGLDAVALKIREIAEASKVPVVEDPPLARALYASVEVDEQIPQQHFEAVAQVIGFVMRQAERRRSGARPL